MVKIGPPGPMVNTLDVDEQWTYANTLTETWQVIKFFLDEMELVDVADLKPEEDLQPEDHNCDICAGDFTEEDHRSVRLPCSHIFGEPCIKKWLSPYAPYRVGPRVLSVGANTCPNCRRVFFPEQRAIDILPVIEMRIMLWDKVYAFVGVALSERERQARDDLLQYLSSYPTSDSDVYYPDNVASPLYLIWAAMAYQRLLMFSQRLRRNKLTPVQEQLRQDLENFAKDLLLRRSKWHRNEEGDMVFDIEEIPDEDTDWESDDEVEVEEESEELTDGDTEEMRFFRVMFR